MNELRTMAMVQLPLNEWSSKFSNLCKALSTCLILRDLVQSTIPSKFQCYCPNLEVRCGTTCTAIINKAARVQNMYVVFPEYTTIEFARTPTYHICGYANRVKSFLVIVLLQHVVYKSVPILNTTLSKDNFVYTSLIIEHLIARWIQPRVHRWHPRIPCGYICNLVELLDSFQADYINPLH